MSKSINAKITVTAQIGDGDVYEIGTADLPITADANGKAALNIGQAIRDALGDHPVCGNHRLLQYSEGGWLTQGDSIVENKTGRPETILNSEQWGRLTARNKE